MPPTPTTESAPAARLWEPVRQELDRWRDGGLTLRLWLRDDDAVAPSAQLDRLIGLSESFALPVLLAVVPLPAEPALAAALAAAPRMRPCQHGFRHHNHAPPGGKAEFGPHRAPETMLAELAGGGARMQKLFGARALSVFVPPWNRIDPRLVAQLPALGFCGLSTFRTVAVPPAAGLTTINTDFDIIDWKAGRIGRPHAALVAELAMRLAARREAGEHRLPFGVLTHHLVHDATAWGFLHDLLAVTHDHPAVAYADPAALFAAPVAAGAAPG